MTLANLSVPAALSISFLNDLEHDRHVPGLKALIRIAHALGLSAIEFLEGIPLYRDPPKR